MKNYRYPLSEDDDISLKTSSGRSVDEISMENLLSGQLTPDDLRIHSHTLNEQARIAQKAGFSNLAENLLRAAELTRVPNETLLTMYEALRPGRSSTSSLHQLATRLEEEFDAPFCANFVRQAAEIYDKRNLTTNK